MDGDLSKSAEEQQDEFIYKIEALKKPKEDVPEIINYLIAAREINASDIYFSVDECPVLKRNSKFHKLLESPFYRAEEVKRLIYDILKKDEIKKFGKRPRPRTRLRKRPYGEYQNKPIPRPGGYRRRLPVDSARDSDL